MANFRPWTEHEDNLVRQMVADKVDIDVIAERVGRTGVAVRHRIKAVRPPVYNKTRRQRVIEMSEKGFEPLEISKALGYADSSYVRTILTEEGLRERDIINYDSSPSAYRRFNWDKARRGAREALKAMGAA